RTDGKYGRSCYLCLLVCVCPWAPSYSRCSRRLGAGPRGSAQAVVAGRGGLVGAAVAARRAGAARAVRGGGHAAGERAGAGGEGANPRRQRGGPEGQARHVPGVREAAEAAGGRRPGLGPGCAPVTPAAARGPPGFLVPGTSVGVGMTVRSPVPGALSRRRLPLAPGEGRDGRWKRGDCACGGGSSWGQLPARGTHGHVAGSTWYGSRKNMCSPDPRVDPLLLTANPQSKDGR
ncbi:unnamed protein product, partial [Prorocentrum cordatum]